MFDPITDGNNNEEIIEGSNLNVNATAAARKSKPSILRGKQKKQVKSSEMPTGAVAKMMAKKIATNVGEKDNVLGWMAYSTKMAYID